MQVFTSIFSSNPQTAKEYEKKAEISQTCNTKHHWKLKIGDAVLLKDIYTSADNEP